MIVFKTRRLSILTNARAAREQGHRGHPGSGPSGPLLGIIDRRGLDPWYGRQWNEFRIARHMAKSPFAPILFRLLDAISGTGDKVPPNVPRAIQRGTAEQQQLHRRER